ncbi:MAG: lipocalin family protein, partial [Alistipes sp.]|nr:lipocalin family protein [Alistipes sp.]
VSTEYTLLDDGKIRIVNQGVDTRTGAKKEAVGRGRITSTVGLLRVAFFGFFYADYRILELSPDYSWALVGGNSDRYLWILSRTPTLPAATLQQILRLAEQRGYDTKRLIYVDQP